MSSLTDFLLARPSAQERYLSLQSLLGGTAQAHPSVGTAAPTTSSTGVLQPGDPLLSSRRGVTLQDQAMQSLLDIARQYGAMPGARELGSVTDSYRSPEQQAAAYAAKPGVAAAPGASYHQQGLAVDWGWASQQPELVRLLQAAGWNRFDPESEPWHWSFGVTG